MIRRITLSLSLIFLNFTLFGMDNLPAELHTEILIEGIKNSKDIVQGEDSIKAFALVCKKNYKVVKDNKSNLIEMLVRLPLGTLDAIPLYCTCLVKKLSGQPATQTGNPKIKKKFLNLDSLNDAELCGRLSLSAKAHLKDPKVWDITYFKELKNDRFGNFKEQTGQGLQWQQYEESLSGPLSELKKAYEQVISDLKKGWTASSLNPEQGLSLKEFYKTGTKTELNLMQNLIRKFNLDKNPTCRQSEVSDTKIVLEINEIIFAQFQSIFNLDIKQNSWGSICKQ